MTRRIPTFVTAGIAAMGLPIGGCVLSGKGLDFPKSPALRAPGHLAYDVDRNGVVDFHVRADERGRMDLLCYDDDEDGVEDRVFRLHEYPPERVPHLIILLDSIPFEPAAARAAASEWTWFDEPRKVIPPFPTMSGLIFTQLLHAPPLGGAINQYYDRAVGKRQDRIMARANGDKNPWERRLHYRLKYWENGLSFLRPRACFQTELARVRLALNDSPDRVTIVYVASTAGMVSKHGMDGLNEVLDGLEQLCVNILHERRGAIKISVVADHGHNFIAGSRIDLPALLKSRGFSPGDRLLDDADVVVELDGLLNYAGIHTRQPARVADALCAIPEIDMAMYQEGERVMIQTSAGRACIEHRSGFFRYVAIDGDVLDYEPLIDRLRATGSLDPEGYASDRDWFDATVDHRWPDAPRRAWDAFHGAIVSTPDVMVTTAPGYFVGLSSMERYITMLSTHGGFDQIDSAAVLFTMTGRAPGPLRSSEVLPTIEPTFDPDRKPR